MPKSENQAFSIRAVNPVLKNQCFRVILHTIIEKRGTKVKLTEISHQSINDMMLRFTRTPTLDRYRILRETLGFFKSFGLKRPALSEVLHKFSVCCAVKGAKAGRRSFFISV